MGIFTTYTGNAMLNSSLMTIEALAELNDVTQITPRILLDLFNKHKLWELYPRMKSYSMLFSRNGPLLNDAKNGVEIYKRLFAKILEAPEKDGRFLCEISGLRFNTPFREIYAQVLTDLKVSQAEIDKKDLSINRCWFPLVGALGSDAQALPQAKFEVSIHPICLMVIQFLPFSSLLYKGGILLFDSTNFEFSRDYIHELTDRVRQAIESTSVNQQIENIRDFDKGKFLLRAIELYSQKIHRYRDLHTDINLWSFTNSGTGAHCEIDRVPNRTFWELYHLYKKPDCQTDLLSLLTGKHAARFIMALENHWDYAGLYPLKDYEGVSVAFFEEFQRLIKADAHLPYAKYIAGLIRQAKGEEKLLAKTDAYSQKEYAAFFHKTLANAASQGLWSLAHHINILNDPEVAPVNSSTSKIHKKVHFYYQKYGEWEPVELPDAGNQWETTTAGKICIFLIHHIEKDNKENFKQHAELLSDPQKYEKFNPIIVIGRQCAEITLEQINAYLCREYRPAYYGLNFLLRVYFSQKQKILLPTTVDLEEAGTTEWLQRLEEFANFYTSYYLQKYEGDWKKFYKHVVLPFPVHLRAFQDWLNEAFKKMRIFYNALEPSDQEALQKIEEFEESLCFDDYGNYNLLFVLYALRYCFNRLYHFQPQNL